MQNQTLSILSALLMAGCSAATVNRGVAAQSTGKIYAFESDANGFNTKNYFYDNGEEVVAFDTQFTPALARQSIAFLRTKTDRPITTVVITHPNPDKFNGMAEFQKLGAKVIASRDTAENLAGVHAYKKYYFVNVAKMFTDATYPALGAVDETFDRTLEIRLKNGETIHLRELARPGVSTNQTIALIPSANAAIVGDLVHTKAHAWLEGGIVNGKPTPTLAGWIADLGEIREILKDAPDTMIYGGRGEATTVNEAIPAEIAYLEKADRIVADYAASLAGKAADYAALQSRFERAFPGYALGYMIQYGAYGLVNSKL